MKSKLLELINKYKKKVDYLEIRVENNSTNQIRFFGKSLDSLNQSEAQGGYVRSCYKGSWGFCSFNKIENLEKYIEETIKLSLLLCSEGNDKTVLAPFNPVNKTCPIKLTGKDPRKISLTDKVELFKHYNNLINLYSD